MQGYWKSGGKTSAPALFSNNEDQYILLKPFQGSENSTIGEVECQVEDDYEMASLIPGISDGMKMRWVYGKRESDEAILSVMAGILVYSSNAPVRGSQANAKLPPYGDRGEWFNAFSNAMVEKYGNFGIDISNQGFGKAPYTMRLNTRYVGYAGSDGSGEPQRGEYNNWMYGREFASDTGVSGTPGAKIGTNRYTQAIIGYNNKMNLYISNINNDNTKRKGGVFTGYGCSTYTAATEFVNFDRDTEVAFSAGPFTLCLNPFLPPENFVAWMSTAIMKLEAKVQ